MSGSRRGRAASHTARNLTADRSLAAVTATSNRSKADQHPAQ
ncbi:hypothetical protein [Streptomyces sp. NPDC049813]